MLTPSRFFLVGAALFVTAPLAACGGDAGNNAAREEIARVIDQGQQALIQDRPESFCALLTPQARDNSLAYAVEYDGSGLRSPARAPKTCAAAIADQLRFARANPGGLRRLRAGTGDLSFVSVTGRSAHVRLPAAGIDVYLVKTREGWRADRSDDFPFDGGTGA